VVPGETALARRAVLCADTLHFEATTYCAGARAPGCLWLSDGVCGVVVHRGEGIQTPPVHRPRP
jgi:hypothetical protein